MSKFVVFLGDGSSYDPNGLIRVHSKDVEKLQAYITDNNETLERLAKDRHAKDNFVAELLAEIERLKHENVALCGMLLS